LDITVAEDLASFSKHGLGGRWEGEHNLMSATSPTGRLRLNRISFENVVFSTFPTA